MKDNPYYNLLVLRPTFPGFQNSETNVPIIKKLEISNFETKKFFLTNYKHLKKIKDKSNTILCMFNYDYVLNSIWNNPLKHIITYKNFLAVCTPDFSVYSNMNIEEIRHNIFKSRWVGSLWQYYGINVIPTISWCLPDTYDICFSGIEKGTVVCISNFNINNSNVKIFLDGFNEMKKRLNPSLIIVKGKIIKGMKGKFSIFTFSDTFDPNINCNQLKLFETNNYIEIN